MIYEKVLNRHILDETDLKDFDFNGFGPVIRHFDIHYKCFVIEKYTDIRETKIKYHGQPMLINATKREPAISMSYLKKGANKINYYEKYLIKKLKLLERFEYLRPYAFHYLSHKSAKRAFSDFKRLEKLIEKNAEINLENVLLTELDILKLIIKSYEFGNINCFKKLARLVYKNNGVRSIFLNNKKVIEDLNIISPEYFCYLAISCPIFEFLLNFKNFCYILAIKNLPKEFNENLSTLTLDELPQIYLLRRERCRKFGLTQIALSFSEIKENSKINCFKPVNSLILLLCLKRQKTQLCKWLRIEICKYF